MAFLRKMLESSKRCWLTTPSRMPPRRREIGGDGFLDLNMFTGLGANLQRLQAEIGERAEIDIVDIGVAADLFISGDEGGAVPCGEVLAAHGIDVGAHRNAETDVPIGEGVFVGDGSGSDYSYSHVVTLIIMRVHR
jgi:hypothetical protein